MIRPNLRHLVAAAFSLFAASSVANAQYPPMGGHPPLLQMPRSGYQAPIVNHQIEGDPDLWDEEQPIERLFSNVAARSWLRLEFMLWDFRGPGEGFLGPGVTGLNRGVFANQQEGLNVPIDFNDNLNGGVTVGQTLFPTLGGIGDQDLPGIRGTWGVDLVGAEMELSFFGTEQSGDGISHLGIADGRIRQRNLVDNTINPDLGTATSPNYAIPLTTDGVVQDVAAANALIFNNSLKFEMESQIWGTELTFLTEKKVPGGAGASWQWLAGARYLSFDEAFNVVGTNGTFDGVNAMTITQTTNIHATTVNNLYGPEFGGRFALTSKYLTFSVTPRVMFGLNDRTSTVVADPLGLGAVKTSSDEIDFGTVTQLNLATELHLSPKFSLYAGYDFMWLPRVTRPDDNISFDSVTPVGGGTPVVSVTEHMNLTDFFAQGFSVGATFRY
ncbi:MAG: BBP7 family outer membrane beta-barrel protein [Planctomycetaceae bacterium]|nr:BBP7 family outer membrane beta-barrel protein [Planctomycetaceae bacterium]